MTGAHRRASCLVALFFTFTAAVASATPVISRSFVYVDNRSAADPFGTAGLTLHLEIIATDTEGPTALGSSPAAAAVLSSSNPSFPFTLPVLLGQNAMVVVPEPGGVDFIRFLPITADDLPSITGSYTLVVRNTSLEVATATQNLLRPEVLGFPTNIAASDHSTTPIVTFTDPNPPPGPELFRGYQLQIIDASTLVIFASTQLLQTPEFAIPPNSLTPGHDYLFRANIFDLDLTQFTDGCTQNCFGVTLPVVAASREYLAFSTAKDASDQIGDLASLVKSFHFKFGIENSLLVKLRAALNALLLDDATTACVRIQAFMNEARAQQGKKVVNTTQGQEMIDGGSQIRDALGCP
jgi:hypothetical protein